MGEESAYFGATEAQQGKAVSQLHLDSQGSREGQWRDRSTGFPLETREGWGETELCSLGCWSLWESPSVSMAGPQGIRAGVPAVKALHHQWVTQDWGDWLTASLLAPLRDYTGDLSAVGGAGDFQDFITSVRIALNLVSNCWEVTKNFKHRIFSLWIIWSGLFGIK